MKKIILGMLITFLLVSCGKADEISIGDDVLPEGNIVEENSSDVNVGTNIDEDVVDTTEETPAEADEVIQDENPAPAEVVDTKIDTPKKETPVVPAATTEEETPSQENVSETTPEKEETTDIEISEEVENLFNELLNDTDQSINQIENGQ